MKKLMILVLILILSCNGTKTTTEITEPEYVLSESDFVILPFQEKWHWIFKNVEPTELTQTELTEIEDILKIAVDKNNQAQKEYLLKNNIENPKNKRKKTGFELKLNGYYRQYVPVINEKGEKEIWINFFCSDLGSENWRTDIFTVFDGGNCFWNIKVNLTKKEYYELGINGYA
ncbi:hypothetical protein ACGK9U_15920 [Mariniflexile sp. HNIBRBA6329]|uniref:hypothetical protein n=1 Tax=Mariniflexile sp. HNIBRBA6329 TaxID=3373088 RepID=UPI003744F873